MALGSSPPVSPEGRRGYDEMMARTPIADGVECTPAIINGVPGWWCRPADAVPGTAILYFHGGCYVLGSATAYRGLASQLAGRAKAATFVADYRLAPEHPFPAAFEDACKALDGIAAEGFHSIAVSGDSAGGGLSLALLASGAAKTRAVAGALFSPWLDLSLSGETMSSRSDVDPILSRTMLQQAVDQYLVGAKVEDPRASPLVADLSKLPPIHIDVGDAEVLLDDSRRFEVLVSSAHGPSCDLHVWKWMIHVFPANIAMLKAASEALDGAAKFLENELGAH